jgi:phenylacetate-CoA ligase
VIGLPGRYGDLQTSLLIDCTAEQVTLDSLGSLVLGRVHVAMSRALMGVSARRRAIRKHADGFRESEWFSESRMACLQREAVQRLLTHAARSVPYWRSILSAYDAPHDVPLRELPILEKSDLRNQFEMLISEDIDTRSWYENRSGGSTGEPVTVLQDQEYFVRSEARKQVFFEATGWSPGEKWIRLWGSERDILQGGQGIRGRIANTVGNRLMINAFRMTPAIMRQHIGVLNQQGPALIHAYAQAAYELARFAEREGIEIRPQRAVVSTSGTLYPAMRQTMERSFGCKVFDQYGSREVSVIAGDCGHSRGEHVAMETNLVEIVDESGVSCPAGVEGDILVTSLTNFAMPLIRYRIGDRGVFSDTELCDCGRSSVRLAQVTGRSMDCFRRRDGGIVPAEYFIHFFGVVLNNGWVAKVQLVQHEFDRFTLKIVAAGAAGDGEAEHLVDAVRRVMGDNVAVDVALVDEIPLASSGKYRYTICELAESA